MLDKVYKKLGQNLDETWTKKYKQKIQTKIQTIYTNNLFFNVYDLGL
jgi:hypothetical protein